MMGRWMAEIGVAGDDELAALVVAGDVALYEVLMRRHNQKVYRAVRSIIADGDESEIEDVMQQAYLAAFVHLSQFRAEARFSTWLVRIAVHEALARQRKKGRFVSLASEPAEGASDHSSWKEPLMSSQHDPERVAQSRELATTLDALIAELPVGYRAVFVLREIEELTTSEVAHALDLSEDNVKARLHRAKHALRDGLMQRIGEAALHAWRFDAVRCDRVVAAVLAGLRV